MRTPPPQPEPLSPPAGWRTTRDPLRIAVIGWARLSWQGREGSGYNLNASELATGLRLSGHEVSYLWSGGAYRPWPGMGIGFHQWWRGIPCYRVFNSPNLSPSAVNFRNVKREVSSPAHTRLVLGWLDEVGARVVHVHSNEGYGLDLIGAIAETGRPVVVTLHNYWYVCPQVDLLYNERFLCDDYEGGRRCVGCMESAPHPLRAKWKRKVGQLVERIVSTPVNNGLKQAAKAFVGRIQEPSNGDPGYVAKSPDPDPELARGFEADAGPADGTIDHGLALGPNERPKAVGRVPVDQNERFLASDVHLRVVNEYGRRRVAGVEALNRASLVTPPSDFLRRVHVAMGVEESRTRTVRLGQPHFDQLQRRARRAPTYEVRPWEGQAEEGPLRLAFFGTAKPNKGLEVLVRAIEGLEPEVRRRCQFHINAAGFARAIRKRLSRFPEVALSGGYDFFQLIGSWGAYHVGIVPHIWFENSPLVLLEHLHGGKFVISARLGGPPEWVVEPPEGGAAGEGERADDGLLFAGGHDEELGDRITRVVRGEVPLPSPREVHACTPHLQTYPGHVAEFEGIYRELLSGGAPDRARSPVEVPERAETMARR